MENLTKNKILLSLQKAVYSVDEVHRLSQKNIREISNSIYDKCNSLEEDPIDIDTVENFIEEYLFNNGAPEVGRQYVKYRYEKERIRSNTTITGKIMAKNVQNQNANVDEFSFGGRIRRDCVSCHERICFE